MGGPSGKFPTTRWSAIVAARSEDSAERARGLETIATSYWKPVYKYIRLRWGKSNEEAKDLTQEFFARAIEKGFLDKFDPAKGRLRTFLRTCVDGLVANHHKAATRLKRGGGAAEIPLDFDTAEEELHRVEVAAPDSMEDFFEREYTRNLFSLAVESFRRQCEEQGKTLHFRIFELYDLEDGANARPTYQSLADQYGISATDVTNHLAFCRREFRRLVLERLRELTSNDEEFRREARALLGVETP